MTDRPTARALALAGLLSAGLALGGCISVLPKSKPANLYRFGQAPPAAASAADPAVVGAVGVFRAPGSFQRESAGDRILTLTDRKAAYVAQTRWVAPAATLFDEAVLTAFDRDNGPARLVSRGEAGRADYALRLDVRNFETHYDQGPKAAPLVVIRLRATLFDSENRRLAGEQFIEAQVRAGDNRVGAIVQAYDAAAGEVIAKLVDWTNRTAQPIG